MLNVELQTQPSTIPTSTLPKLTPPPPPETPEPEPPGVLHSF